MKKFIFIHGACQGGWCWSRIEQLLKSGSIDYEIPDLPGHGDDRMDIKEVTLEKYVESIRNIIKKTAKKIVLIGHSMGGFIASMAADLDHEKVDKIVYIASPVPVNNETISGLLKMDGKSKLLQHTILSEDRSYVEIDPDYVNEILFNNCPAEDMEFAKGKLCRQSVIPFNTPVKLTENFEKVPKYYIKTLYDNSVSIEFQNELCGRYKNMMTKEIGSGHAPYFSHYKELYDLIINDSW